MRRTTEKSPISLILFLVVIFLLASGFLNRTTNDESREVVGQFVDFSDIVQKGHGTIVQLSETFDNEQDLRMWLSQIFNDDNYTINSIVIDDGSSRSDELISVVANVYEISDSSSHCDIDILFIRKSENTSKVADNVIDIVSTDRLKTSYQFVHVLH